MARVSGSATVVGQESWSKAAVPTRSSTLQLRPTPTLCHPEVGKPTMCHPEVGKPNRRTTR
ncbi:MAG TPA: hypothetical protein VGF11_05780 [Acidimicrobiales bacterium]